MTILVRVLDAPPDEKAALLLAKIAELSDSGFPLNEGRQRIFERDANTFSVIPGSPFAYWAGDAIRSIFASNLRLHDTYLATRGAYTTDDFRFYRLSWEVSNNGVARARKQTLADRPYVGLAKGGSFSQFYSDLHLVIRWADNGKEAKAFLSAYRERKGWGTDWSACLNGYGHYFRMGLSWPRRTQKGLNLRAMPAGSIFTDKGPAIFADNDNPEMLLSLLAVANSTPFRYLVALQMAFGSYEVGVIQRTPLPTLTDSSRRQLASLARRAWSLSREIDSVNEISHAFILPSLLSERALGFNRTEIEHELQTIQNEIDDCACAFYGVSAKDRAEIEPVSDRSSSLGNGPPEDDEAAEDETDDISKESGTEVLSWLVGVALGRFDIRLATGERPMPPEPEPFDPLPAQSPGMWPTDEERPVPPPDILVDDLGHRRDLTSHVSAGAELVSVDVPEDLRRWLAREFFPLHIKMYSKSRRKAPIYWQWATPSASYSVWLYIHAFSGDTMFRVQNDYVVPKLRHEESRLQSMEREAGERATAAQRKAIAEQEAFVEELRGFLDEVKRVAPLWSPNLDDGVIINFSPLWRLVPHHRPWQKELKATWDVLSEGKYDWAHLAMRLWPERVVPKCAADRSLAIAHGLEDVFWAQASDGKWASRATPTRPIEELIAERASDAVKAALRSLLDASTAVRARADRRRSVAGASNGGVR